MKIRNMHEEPANKQVTLTIFRAEASKPALDRFEVIYKDSIQFLENSSLLPICYVFDVITDTRLPNMRQ